jgi:hypothetical protein
MIPSKSELVQKCTLVTLKNIVGQQDERPSGISKWKVEDYRVFLMLNVETETIEKAVEEQIREKKTKSMERKKLRLSMEQEKLATDMEEVTSAKSSAVAAAAKSTDEVVGVKWVLDCIIQTGSKVVWYTHEGCPRFGLIERLNKTAAKVKPVKSHAVCLHDIPGGFEAKLIEPEDFNDNTWNSTSESMDCSVLTLYNPNQKYWQVTTKVTATTTSPPPPLQYTPPPSPFDAETPHEQDSL